MKSTPGRKNCLFASSIEWFSKRSRLLISRDKKERAISLVLQDQLELSGMDHASMFCQKTARNGCSGCSREHCPLLITEDLEPAPHVGGVIHSRFGPETKLGTKERCAQFGDEFLHRIREAAELPGQIPV